MTNAFQGRTTAVRVCKNCGNLSEKQEEFKTVQLEVRNQPNVYAGLKRFTAAEQIEGYDCSACKQKAEISRRIVLHKLPNFLILHLQRIVFDPETFMNKKINARVEFPSVLNVKPFTSQEIFKDQQEVSYFRRY
jgi:ubiquitin carboxyl-terminal hydrolase 34